MALLARHRAFVALLAAGLLLRVLVAIAYRPALFFPDSFFYIGLVDEGSPVGFGPERPSGYPLLIELLWLPGRSHATLAVANHLFGLAAGVGAYALALRLGARTWLACGAAALVLLDGYAIAVEQHVLTEAAFTLLVIGALALALVRPDAGWALAASGALLGVAATFRVAAIFAVPVWIAYVLWLRPGLRPLAAAAVGLAAPLAAYSLWHGSHTGAYGLTQSDGWALNARVGEIGECGDADIPEETRPLCDRNERDERETSQYFLLDERSPAARTFGPMTPDPDRQARTNALLRRHALAIIRDRPLRYAGVVARDFVRFYEPGAASDKGVDGSIELPRVAPPDLEGLPEGFTPERARAERELPDSGGLAGALRTYQRAVHVPRWLLAGLTLVALAALFLPRRVPRRREIGLLIGAAIALLLGSAATYDFELRYLLPAVLPTGVAGVVAVERLLASRRATAGRGSAAPPAPARPAAP